MAKTANFAVPEVLDLRIAKQATKIGEGLQRAIRLLRWANGLSQRNLAERMGCARTWISKVEGSGNATTASLASIEKLCVALDCTPFALVTLAEALQ